MTLSRLIFALCLSLHIYAAKAQGNPPNFIVIMADDLGYGDLGVYGSTLIQTPNLDRLAINGVRLDSFYSSANVCTAARGGLLTGRYPIRLGLVTDVARPTNEIHLEFEEITIAEALKPLGYRSALLGKWHLGSRLEWSPVEQGFDEFFGVLHSNDMAPLELYRGKKMIENPVDQTTLTERYTQEAVKFIAENKNSPFFLYLPHSFPHVPLFVSPRFDGRSNAGLYGDVVETIDWSTGEILSALDKYGLSENTLVIFTSDNGPWFEGSSGIFRNRKGSSWEGGQRVPFLAQWPGKIPAGTVSSEPVMNIDLYPTLVSLAGGQLPDDRKIDGKNTFPLLTGSNKSPHEALFLFDRDRIVGVRSGQWKLVIETRYRATLNSFEHSTYYGPDGLLFDLQNDPGETYSFAREYPDVVQQLRTNLLNARKDFKPAVLPQMWNRP